MKQLSILLLLFISHFAFAQNARFLIPYREGNKWGYCDTLGKVKIAPKYKSVDFFIGNEKTRCPVALAVINDSAYTYIDSSGKSVLPAFINKKVTTYIIDDKIHFEVKNLKTQKIGLYIDKKLVVEPVFDYLNSIYPYNNCILVQQKNKQGLLNENGEIVIPIQFDKITASYYLTTEKEIVWFGIKGNSKVKFVIKSNNKFSYQFFKNNCLNFMFRDKDELERYAKEKNEERKKTENSSLKNPDEVENKIIVDTAKGLTYYDSLLLFKDSLKKTLALDSIYQINEDRKFYYVEKGGKQGIIDDSLRMFLMDKNYKIHKLILNHTDSWLYKKYQSLVLITYIQNGKYGATNEFDDEILPPVYDYFLITRNYGDNYFEINKNHKWGYFLINTIYSPIAAKYPTIELSKQLNININWSFGLFEIKDEKGNFLGYVGENGIEYFKN